MVVAQNSGNDCSGVPCPVHNHRPFQPQQRVVSFLRACSPFLRHARMPHGSPSGFREIGKARAEGSRRALLQPRVSQRRCHPAFLSASIRRLPTDLRSPTFAEAGADARAGVEVGSTRHLLNLTGQCQTIFRQFSRSSASLWLLALGRVR